jgi:hypothetical protein
MFCIPVYYKAYLIDPLFVYTLIHGFGKKIISLSLGHRNLKPQLMRKIHYTCIPPVNHCTVVANAGQHVLARELRLSAWNS